MMHIPEPDEHKGVAVVVEAKPGESEDGECPHCPHCGAKLPGFTAPDDEPSEPSPDDEASEGEVESMRSMVKPRFGR